MQQKKYDIGVIGLGVMGLNLLLNMADHGYSAVGYDRVADRVRDLDRRRAPGHAIRGTGSPRECMALLKSPRVVVILVPAGPPVDAALRDLIPLCRPADILIDCGNSHFTDTALRQKALARKGIHFLGVGISGGEKGARHGPSIMPGGPREAYVWVKNIFEAIAADVRGEPCVAYLGPGAAGHFVKMVHNGIEYAMMQAIAETYDMMKRLVGMKADEIAGVFDRWNGGILGGYLVSIVPPVLTMKDGSGLLVDSILDRAFQKGTGKDASIAALGLGVPVPAMDEAVSERFISAMIEERRRSAGIFPAGKAFTGDGTALAADLEDALYCAIAIAHGQGFSLVRKASLEYGWGLDRCTIARVWRGGCIIQSKMMDDIEALFRIRPDAGSILMEEPLAGAMREKQAGWRRAVSSAVLHGVPAPVLASTLAYFDSYRSERLPANLLQAMRDLFGAHGYERVDAPAGTLFRTEWKR